MEAGRHTQKASNVSAAVTVDARLFQLTIVLGKKVLVYILPVVRSW